jgi:hypothetical protein
MNLGSTGVGCNRKNVGARVKLIGDKRSDAKSEGSAGDGNSFVTFIEERSVSQSQQSRSELRRFGRERVTTLRTLGGMRGVGKLFIPLLKQVRETQS